MCFGFEGDWEHVREAAAETRAIAEYVGAPYHLACADVFEGYATFHIGDQSEGLTMMRSGLTAHERSGAYLTLCLTRRVCRRRPRAERQLAGGNRACPGGAGSIGRGRSPGRRSGTTGAAPLRSATNTRSGAVGDRACAFGGTRAGKPQGESSLRARGSPSFPPPWRRDSRPRPRRPRHR